ncbi:RagB/SusD family nutrient uptake outer membrane protein [Salisaeta longa]|uniref:RagB/SusD family nutrient uptake outer membrane protein n=1 Tax=Salisaeta longa TaxID=503170 RepID=UPI0004064704|nr:RagB/SusD family nutrient uptake outer membrane protein [Salisaeta longa]
MSIPSFLTARTALLLTGALLVLSACDSFLERTPKQSIPSETALATPQNVEAALVGAYNALGDADLYGGQYMMSPDLLADNGDVQWTGTFEQPAAIWNKNILVSNSFIEAQWTDAYETINIANNVLSAVDVFDDAATAERVRGEALFIRGMLYFELVRLFGPPWSAGNPDQAPGVPLVLEPTREIGENLNVPRASVAAVYQQAIDDLTTAASLLPESNGFFADTYAASAILSRVYLMQGRYQLAAEAANRVIESDLYQLAPTFAQAFNNVSDIPEYIFAIQVTAQDGTNDLNTFYGSQENGGRGDIDIQQQHLNRYAAGDARGAFFYVDGESVVRTAKWRDDEADQANIPVVRLAELYLTRAEGNLRSGAGVGPNTPAEDVSIVRQRAGLSAVSSVTVSDILRERRLELSFEGNLLHDLKRTQRSVGSIPYDSGQILYPIPQREIDANPALEQNPYYSGA